MTQAKTSLGRYSATLAGETAKELEGGAGVDFSFVLE
jgi:hypothetical protein